MSTIERERERTNAEQVAIDRADLAHAIKEVGRLLGRIEDAPFWRVGALLGEAEAALALARDTAGALETSTVAVRDDLPAIGLAAFDDDGDEEDRDAAWVAAVMAEAEEYRASRPKAGPKRTGRRA